MHTTLPQTPVISAQELGEFGPVRIVCAAQCADAPQGLTMGPIDDWISSAKENRIGFDDLAFWKGECVKLGLGPDAVTVVADDGGMLVRAT